MKHETERAEAKDMPVESEQAEATTDAYVVLRD